MCIVLQARAVLTPPRLRATLAVSLLPSVLQGVSTLKMACVWRKLKVAASADGSERQKMVSLVGLDEDEVEDMCRTVVESHGGVCSIANRLFPCGVVVSGSEIAMDQLKASAKDRGAEKVSELKEGNAGFHTSLMSSAEKGLKVHLFEMLRADQIRTPEITVYSSQTGERWYATDDKRRGFADWVDQPEQLRRCVPGDD